MIVLVLQENGSESMNTSSNYILQALQELGFQSYTPIQELVIPKLRTGRNAIIQSSTGTGKTHSYLIPLVERLDLSLASLQAVISAPTKELARQIHQFLKQLVKFFPQELDIRLYVGGTDRNREVKRLEGKQPIIAIGTPGKLLDLMKAQALKVYKANMLVIDEADMTMDAGFLEEMDQLASQFSSSCQIVCVSATVNDAMKQFFQKYLQNPMQLSIKQEQLTALPIRHWLIKTKEQSRLLLLRQIFDAIQPYLAIVFCNTKESAEVVYQAMSEWTKHVCLVHGGLEERKRKQLLQRIRQSEFQWIVATDVISRGIDLDSISHIINYELPQDAEFYVHRSGRTGRMNQDGVCISLYGYENDVYLNQLEEKGLRPSYVRLENGVFDDAPVRNQRAKRNRPTLEKAIISREVGPKPTKVKPGYKKKNQAAVQKVAKQVARKRGNRP